MDQRGERVFSGILGNNFSKFQPRMRLGASAQLVLDALLTEQLDTTLWVLKRAMQASLSTDVGSATCDANILSAAASPVTHQMVQSLLPMTFATELKRFANSEGCKAVTKHLHGGFQVGEPHPPGVIFSPHEHARDENLFKQTSLTFPCAKIGCYMIEAGLQPTLEAVVFLTATLEYTTAELMELSGSAAGARDKFRIEELVGGKHMNASDLLAARLQDPAIEHSYPCLIPISDACDPTSDDVYADLLTQAMDAYKNDLLKPWDSPEPLPGLEDTTSHTYLDLSLNVSASLLGGKAIVDAEEYRAKVADPLISYIRARSEEARLCVPVSTLTLSRHSWARRRAGVYHWQAGNGAPCT